MGSYRLQVRVSEPVWPDVTCTAQVDILELQPEALQSSASIRLSSESASGAAVSTTWHCLSSLFLRPVKLRLSLFFADLTVEQFFASRGSQPSPFSRLSAILAEVLEEPTEYVHIFSVGRVTQLGVESVNVWVAADGCRREKILGYVEVNRAKVSAVDQSSER